LLDPNLAEAYMARARIAPVLDAPVESAIPDFKRALALDPNLAQAHFFLAATYLQMGCLDEALSELNEVLALDPYNVPPRYYVARVHMYQQRYDEAFMDFQRSPDFSTDLLWLKVLVLFYRGEMAGAHELIGELRRKLPDNSRVASTYAVLLAAEGKNVEAEEQIRLAIRTRSPNHTFSYPEYNIASAYALMGNRRDALYWLRKTVEDRLAPYPVFERDPNLNNLRDDPDFKTWLGEMKALWMRRRASL
jgi:tetratricopeptide (TPR) repeat protein